MAKSHIADCRIHYLENSILVDFQPGCANFSYWVHQKVADHRWKQTGTGVRLGCEVTEDEAAYIENIAKCQWGPEGCEVIGKPVEEQAIQAVKEPEKVIESIESIGQLSLF